MNFEQPKSAEARKAELIAFLSEATVEELEKAKQEIETDRHIQLEP